MNDLESRNVPAGGNDELRQQCASLQRQVTTLLLAVFVLSGTVTVFLWRQARYARADLEVLKLPASQVFQSYKQEKVMIDDFVARLTEFSKKDQNFAPIFNKYKFQPAAPAAATSAPPAAVTSSAPPIVPAATQKK